MTGPSVECSQRCYDEISFLEWVAWLASPEVLWVIAALALSYFGFCAIRRMKKELTDEAVRRRGWK